MNFKRDTYQAIVLSSLNQATLKQVKNLFDQVKDSKKLDEHGNWAFGATFDRKGRGSALNWDLYGIGRDHFTRRLMLVIQIRQYVKRSKHYFPQIRKSYFLVGRNEDNTAFAHPVHFSVVHKAIASGSDVIRACQNWIFGCEYTRIIRQGDIALLPIRTKKGMKVDREELLLQESHLLKARTFYREGEHLYANNPAIYHLPGTHPNFTDLEGWYKVIVGKRANYYDFAAPTID